MMVLFSLHIFTDGVFFYNFKYKFKVREWARNPYQKYTKGHNSVKTESMYMLLSSAHRLIVVYIYLKPKTNTNMKKTPLKCYLNKFSSKYDLGPLSDIFQV